MTRPAPKRHRCYCSCDCDSTADARVEVCSSCSVGAHKPMPAVRDHLRAGLYEWARLLPAKPGPAQVDDAADAWALWHQARPCPVPR